MEEDQLLSLNQPSDLFGSNDQLTSATAALDFHLEEESSLYDVIEQKTNDFFASQSSTFNQDRLPSSEVPVVTAASLPYGPVLINGVYYQPVLAPNKAQSTVPASTVVPCVPEPAASEPVFPKEQPAASEKPKVGLEFVMPETPPPKKSIINLQLTNRSRSISRQCKKRKSPKASPKKTKPEVRPTRRGRGKKKLEMTNVPILVPTTHLHLIKVTNPKPGLTVNFSSNGSIPRTVQHLSKFMIETTGPLETNSAPSAETTVTLKLRPIHKDSDMDLETGDIKVSTKAPSGPSKFTYKLKPNADDYKVFAPTILPRKATLWNRGNVRLHVNLFYHSYFQDFQMMSDLKQKAQARIHSFNVRVTRQDDKTDQSSSQVNKQRLEARFRSALRQMYEAFEEAYTLEQLELIDDLRDHLVKPAIAQITSLFVSSRCCTCYGERHQTAAWRQSRFNNLAPLLCEVSNKADKKAEDHRAIVILEKTRIEFDKPPSYRFKLRLSDDDKKIYTALSRNSFITELQELVSINSLICMSKKWDSQKDAPPSLEVSLSHTALQRTRQLRGQNLLPVAQASLNRYHERHRSLITLFGQFKV